MMDKRAMRRRLMLALAAAAANQPSGSRTARAAGVGPTPGAARTPTEPDYAAVLPGHRLRFPRDHGMHPAFRIEWWYITGWLERVARPTAAPGDVAPAGPFGFQLTFFRVRSRHSVSNPSRFAPRQLLLAHAAIADPALGRLRHDQQAWRTGELATIASDDTRIRLPGWQLVREADDSYRAQVEAGSFSYTLRLAADAPPVLQGEDGYSRKGPRPTQASYYYSRPGMRATGILQAGDKQHQVRGSGWLDHEWSSELMPADALGWDWAGIGLEGGGSLLVFRLRNAEGGSVYSHGRLRLPDGRRIDAVPGFEPMRYWESPRTGIRYPVEWRITMDNRPFVLTPLFDDQELDARRSTGTIYWEGAVSARLDGRVVGRGYLELTGYGARMTL